jgi:serine/threonine protein kinase
MGLSKRIGTEITSTTVKGTPGFVAPERIPGIGANPSTADPFPCDMWCLGEVAFFLLTSGTTFENYWELQCYVKGTQNFPQQRLDEVGVSETAIDFIRLLMAVSPAERLSANQADYHLWMTCFNDTPGVQLGTDFDRSPGPSRSTVPNLEKYNERRERRLRTSTDEATIQHDKTLPPEDITEEIPTIPSGSWNTTTKLENISSKSRYLGARTKRRGETGEAQRTAPEDAQDQRPPFPSYIPADTTSDFSDDARDGSSSPNDSIRDKPPFFKTVEILANKIEAREFPSLSSLENSRFKSSRKYARTMRQAIRYICESGVQNILGFTPDTSHRTDTNASLTSFNEDELVVSLPTNSDSEERDAPARGDEDSVSSPSATNVAKGTADTSPDDYFENYDMPPLAWPPRYISEELSDIDEDIEPYPVISSPGELAGLFNAEEDAFLSEGEESSLVDDNHPAKKAKRDTSVFSDHAVNQKTSGSSVCSPKVTRMLGSGEAATRYRQPTVEDAEETE